MKIINFFLDRFIKNKKVIFNKQNKVYIFIILL